MIITEYIDISVYARNKPRIVNILGYDVPVGTIVRIYRNDFEKLNTARCSLEAVCYMCLHNFTRDFKAIVKSKIHICQTCNSLCGRNTMILTIRTPESRKRKSERVSNFYKTEEGARVKETVREKRKAWFQTPDGIKNRQQSGQHLPHYYGSEHHNWNANKDEYEKYKGLVYKETKLHDLSILENYDKPRGLCGVNGAYQLDHIISMKYGFDNDIDPKIIGHINNLRFIPWEENREKWNKCKNIEAGDFVPTK